MEVYFKVERSLAFNRNRLGLPRLRPIKVQACIEGENGSEHVLDEAYMFGGWRFAKRVERKKMRLLRRCAQFLVAAGY